MTQALSAGRCRRRDRIFAAAEHAAHPTEHFSSAARCSLGEAAVELLALEREGRVERDEHAYVGMTWKLADADGGAG
jgi:hypothetical protein